MTLTSPVRIGIDPCGCLNESLRRWRVLQVWRCPRHDNRYVRVEAVLALRRCESCRRMRARYRMTFGDGEAWLVCFECEMPRSA